MGLFDIFKSKEKEAEEITQDDIQEDELIKKGNFKRRICIRNI